MHPVHALGSFFIPSGNNDPTDSLRPVCFVLLLKEETLSIYYTKLMVFKHDSFEVSLLIIMNLKVEMPFQF